MGNNKHFKFIHSLTVSTSYNMEEKIILKYYMGSFHFKSDYDSVNNVDGCKVTGILYSQLNII